MGINVEIEIKVNKSIDEQRLKEINYRLYNCFGCYFEAPGLLPGKSDEYYGKTKTANMYHIHSFSRYYGKDGYERGEIWPYIGIAELLEFMIPEVTIFYGGDCDCDHELFDAKVRELFKKHFFSVGHDPYRGHNKYAHEEDPICPQCGFKMASSGCDHGKEMYSCGGCPYSDWKETK